MKRYIQNLVAVAVLVFGFGVFAAAPADAINVFKGCEGKSASEVCKEAGDDAKVPTLIQNVISTLLIAIGIIAVIMIIIGGIRYTLSNGDSGQISNAKNTILYAVIGLIVAMLAYSIVNFVIGQF